MGLVGRAEHSALRLAPRRIDHALAQRHLEQDPEDHRHQQAARELGSDELPAEEDEQDQAQLEDQVGRGELEDDRVDKARSPAE